MLLQAPVCDGIEPDPLAAPGPHSSRPPKFWAGHYPAMQLIFNKSHINNGLLFISCNLFMLWIVTANPPGHSAKLINSEKYGNNIRQDHLHAVVLLSVLSTVACP